MTPPSTIAKIAERLASEGVLGASEFWQDDLTFDDLVAIVEAVVKELREPSDLTIRIIHDDDRAASSRWRAAIDAILSEHNAERKGEG